MKILVSNDDGVHAEGIHALANEVINLAKKVIVVAPDRNRSGASNSLSLNRPLRVRQLDNGYYSVEGTPTDCIHLALTGFFSGDNVFDETTDIVITGINDGANLGDDVLYSGTVAAAMEGRYLGLTAIAFSLIRGQKRHYQDAARIACQIIQSVCANKVRPPLLLNVNIPDLPIEEIKGVQLTRLGARHRAEPIISSLDPRGRPIYWIGGPGIEADCGPGTDFYATSRNYVSITPLHFDLTHYKVFEQMDGWVNKINKYLNIQLTSKEQNY